MLLVSLIALMLSAFTLPRALSTSLSHNFTITSSSVYSTYLDDSYNITIAVPNNYNETDSYNYPTIYLLDAAYHLDGTHPFLGRDVGPGGVIGIVSDLIVEKDLPSCILVGIGYEGNIDSQRRRDFADNRSSFYNFLKYELIPFIDDNYRTDNADRTLLGHSLGGTFTTYCLLQYDFSSPSLFKRFVTLSGNYLMETFDSLASESAMYERISNSTNPSVDLSVFLAVGEDDLLFASCNEDLIDRLNSRDYKNFRFNGKIYENLDHGSIVRPGFTDGLKWVFSEPTQTSDSVVDFSYTLFAILMLAVFYRFKKANYKTSEINQRTLLAP